jgi:hypothetical protein
VLNLYANKMQSESERYDSILADTRHCTSTIEAES